MSKSERIEFTPDDILAAAHLPVPCPNCKTPMRLTHWEEDFDNMTRSRTSVGFECPNEECQTDRPIGPDEDVAFLVDPNDSWVNQEGERLTDPYGCLKYCTGTQDDFVCLDFAVLPDGRVVLDSVVNSETGSFIQGFKTELLAPGLGEIMMPMDVYEDALDFFLDCRDWGVENELATKRGYRAGPKEKFARDVRDAYEVWYRRAIHTGKRREAALLRYGKYARRYAEGRANLTQVKSALNRCRRLGCTELEISEATR